jgi:hypothetical protein
MAIMGGHTNPAHREPATREVCLKHWIGPRAVPAGSGHPRKSLPELKKAKTPKDWSLESREIAVKKVYLHGNLKGGTSKETAQELPEGYTKAAKEVAEKQAAFAGYRLADEIGKWVR